MRTILVAVDSRATWSRAKTVCEEIQKRDNELRLQLVLVGPLANSGHLLDGIEVGGRFLDPEPSQSMPVTVGHLVSHLSYRIELYHPDIVVSVTDRYESLAVAVAAALSNVHLAHIQGGEVSGGIDESIRHAITKLAHVHFPANAESEARIVLMGEEPAYIFNVGCPATDLLLRVDIGPNPVEQYILVSYNPVTTISIEENQLALVQMLMACENSGLATKVVGPNHDPGGAKLWEVIEFTRETMEHAGRGWLTTMGSLPHTDFVRLMAHASVMVGNSSSGIREACYFGTPVVDVGIRQQGRARTKNVMQVEKGDEHSIRYSTAFQRLHGRYSPEQPFGKGGAGETIAELLATMELPPIQKRIRY